MPVQENLIHSDLSSLTYDAVLKLPEGAHIAHGVVGQIGQVGMDEILLYGHISSPPFSR